MKKFNKKQIAIVGVVAIILVVLVVIIFHTCKRGKANAENTVQAAQNSRADKVDKSKDDKFDKDKDTEANQDTAAEDSKDAGDKTDNKEESLGEFIFVENESGDKYDDFLAGKGTISFSYYRDNVEEATDSSDVASEVFPKQDASLEKLVESINNSFASSDDKIESVSYAFIDCGMDGNRELVLSVNFTEPILHNDFKIVIKDINNKLQVVFACFTSGERWDVYFNEYGVIRSYEVPGYQEGLRYDAYDYMDSTCKIKPIYVIKERYKDWLGAAMPTLEDTYKRNASIGDYDKYFLNESTLMYDSKEYHTYVFYNMDEKIDEEPDIPNLKEAIEKCFEYPSISMDEFNKLKKERLGIVGVPEKAIGEETFEKLEYTQIYKGKAK